MIMAPAWDSLEAICDSGLPYMKNPYWDGKVHKPVKFGESFDPQTVEGRKRLPRLQLVLDAQRQNLKLYGPKSNRV
jgi:hypothetical protein